MYPYLCKAIIKSTSNHFNTFAQYPSLQQSSKPVINYLYPGLRQIGHHGQSLPHHHVRVVCLGEGLLQGGQLVVCERSPAPALLPLAAVTRLQDNVWKSGV
jgi:hypothetical protein